MIFFRIFLFLLFIWLTGFGWFISNIPMIEPAEGEKADAIIVLTGARGRIDAGLHLLSKQYAEHLFVSGVGQQAALEDISKYLTSFEPKQVEELKSAITLGHFASSTEENAVESLTWIKQHNYKKIILVTSNYHMPRSLLLFKHFMPEIILVPYPVIKQISFATLKLLFLEYNKYLLSL